MPDDKTPELHDIQGCEIFATGTWHGDEYTTKDLDAMCEAFGKVGFKPPLKLGHSEKQHLLTNAGLPAAGWVDRIYRKGEKLLADFSAIPKQIHDLIVRKAYDRVSSEIYWDYTHEESKLPRVLKAVALLGSEIPEVTTLDSISALYYDDTGHSFKVVEMDSEKKPKSHNMMYIVATGGCFSLGGEGCHCSICPMSCSCMALQTGGGGCSMMGCTSCICTACLHIEDRVIGTGGKEEYMNKDEEKEALAKEEARKEEEKRLAASEKEKEAVVLFQKDVVEKLATFEKQNKELHEKLAQEKALRREEQVDVKVKEFTKQMRVSPAQAPFLKALYLTASEAPFVVKFDKEEKKLNGDEAIDQFIALQSPFASSEERTKMGVDANDIDIRIKAYCKEHNLDYNGEGYVTAMKSLGIKEV